MVRQYPASRAVVKHKNRATVRRLAIACQAQKWKSSIEAIDCFRGIRKRPRETLPRNRGGTTLLLANNPRFYVDWLSAATALAFYETIDCLQGISFRTKRHCQPSRARPSLCDRRFETENELPWQTQRATSFPALDLNPGTTFQEILGFGVALTDAACYLLDKLAASDRKEFLREIFRSGGDGPQHLPSLHGCERLRG
jgi:hypothetical protein